MEKLCCELYKITKEDIYSANREPHICWPRFILWYAAVKELGIKFKTLGRYYGKHHTSVMHGVLEAGAKEKVDVLNFLKVYRERSGKPVDNYCITGGEIGEETLRNILS
jgi:hypothetical protein